MRVNTKKKGKNMNINTIRTWKAKGKGGTNHDILSHEYFIENDCVACGWSLKKYPNRSSIQSLEDYKKAWKEWVKDYKWGNQGVHHLLDNLKKGDFIWTRSKGVYYVTKLDKEPSELFFFDSSDLATESDCSAQLKVSWVKIGKEDSVPGSISTYNRNNNSFIRVDNNDVTQNIDGVEYTATSLFSSIVIKDRISFSKIEDRRMLFKFIGPSSTEDLVGLWLYDKFNYVTIPSTSKTGTQLYEFVLIDSTRDEGNKYLNNKKKYIQVKNGNDNLKPKKYLELITSNEEELWLVSTLGHVCKNDSNDFEDNSIVRYRKNGSAFDVKTFDVQELLDFVFNANKQNIIPSAITTWLKYFE